jgi:aminoglycoside phosphotransferase (APT) family kinase protein
VTAGALPGDVVGWVEDALGPLRAAEQRPGGARKQAWFIDVAGEELFLRFDPDDPSATGDPWTVHREAVVYRALHAAGLRVAAVRAVHPNRQAVVLERVAGRPWFSRIKDPVEQLATARDFMGQLAALHRIDPRLLDLPTFPEPTSIPDVVAHELDELEGVLSFRGGEPEPGLRLTLDWLRSNVPDHDGPVVLVQGDTGPGNFLYADGRVTAVVDWELAHLGDPMDDIAWLSLRATQEPFTHLPDRLREYEELSGHPVDEARVRYYRVMAEAKLLVMAHGAGDGAVQLDPIVRRAYGTLHRRLWLDALAEVLDTDGLDEIEPLRRETEDSVAELGDVLGGLVQRTWPQLR